MGNNMNWEAMTAIGQTVGALAVVISLIYLTTQIRLANRISIREARADLIDLVSGIKRLPLENPQLARLWVKLQSAETELTPEETLQAYEFASVWLYFLQKVNGAYEAGLLPEKVFNVYLEHFSTMLVKQPGLVPHVALVYHESAIEPGDFAASDYVFNLLSTSDKADTLAPHD
jgi:hypothetical protein